MPSTPLVVGYARSIGASAAMAGLTVGAMNIVSLVLRPLTGMVADRVPYRGLAIAGAVLLLVANLGYTFCPIPAFLLVSRIINGIGFPLVSVCLSAWLSSLVLLGHIGKVMGLYGAVNALAMAFGPTVGIWVRRRAGYGASFLVSTAMVVLMGIAVLMMRGGGGRGRAPVATPRLATTVARAPG